MAVSSENGEQIGMYVRVSVLLTLPQSDPEVEHRESRNEHW